MKKRWLFGLFFALALCVLPAQAAVTSGGVEYIWYTQDGQQTWDNGEIVAFSGQQFFLSADGGESYAQLSEIQESSRQGWTNYDMRVTALENGGLRVEGRSTFGEAGSPYTQRWDYTAQQLAQYLSKAESNPVNVLADNGSVCVGTRTIRDAEDGVESMAPNISAFYLQRGWENQLVWSADGKRWTQCEYPEELDVSYYSMSAWWDGDAFYLKERNYVSTGYQSVDGVRWTAVDELPISPELAYTADLGRYHFEVVLPPGRSDGWYSEVYLMEGNNRNEGVLLPHMGEAIRAQGIGIDSMTAVSGPNDTVTLTVSGNGAAYSLDYPISSLDWCLENLSEPFRDKTEPAATASGSGITLAKVAEHYRNRNIYEMEGELIRDDGSGWKKVEDTPFSCEFRLLPYNGKTFLVEDAAPGRHRLYASTDGLSWTEVTTLRPQNMEGEIYDYVSYAVCWTGSGYIASRKSGVHSHGMMGMGGGNLYEGNTSVYFLDEAFNLTGTYDFSRIVKAVGYLNGVYYAKVTDSEGTQRQGMYHVSEDENGKNVYTTDPGYYNDYAPSTLYRSTDGKTWEPLGAEYMLSVEEDLVGGNFENTYWREDGFPEPRQGGQPLRSVAVLDNWRFVLDKENEVYLCKENTVWWVKLPHVGEAIRANWITPGELTAAYNPDGTVEVKVTDHYTPSMSCSISYPTDSLDWVKENLDGVPADHYNYDYWENTQCKRDASDVTVVERGLGEREVLYRNAGTNDQFVWYDSVPWSNAVTLLPYGGHEYLLLDQRDGMVYRSADGRNWQETTGDWMRKSKDYEEVGYALAWTGERYLGCCYLRNGRGDATRVDWDTAKVFLLDEDLNVLSSHDFGWAVERIGYRNGVYYAYVERNGWDERGRFGTIWNGQQPTLWQSVDGVTWEKADDILNIQAALTPIQ